MIGAQVFAIAIERYSGLDREDRVPVSGKACTCTLYAHLRSLRLVRDQCVDLRARIDMIIIKASACACDAIYRAS